jgi:tetratricopeptide (TPR) repeat protein
MVGTGIKKLIILLALSKLCACGSTSVIKVNSTPSDAEVTILENGTSKVIGKTPLVSNENDIYSGANRYSQIRIKKEGHLEKEVILLKSTFGSETIISVELKKDEQNQNMGEKTAGQEKVANTIARANGLIQSKQYVEAEVVLTNFVEEFPQISVGYDYLGNVSYLQNKYTRALKFYKRAIDLNPNNPERKRIVERIQRLLQTQTETNQ